MKRVLFIDRDGTLIHEPADEQIDAFDKLRFVKGVFRNLSFIRQHLDFEFVMVSNQDGLGTKSFPEETFWPVHNFILQTLEGEGVTFDNILIDCHFPEDNHPCRKPGTGMLTEYIKNSNLNPQYQCYSAKKRENKHLCSAETQDEEPEYDLINSYVIGDRNTDRQLAENIGCKSLILGDDMTWDRIAEILFAGERIAEVKRTTKETDIYVRMNLDGKGTCNINTGLGFFDHMLEQIGKHGMIDLTVHTEGDLNVDEHHTIEDTAIAIGECIAEALGNKRGIERYGYCLPMDDSLCSVALDFGGRPWLVWDAEFHREKIGEMPTEMFLHFFKSLSDAAKMNLNIKAEGQNEHHKIEGIFKALARSLKMAVKRDIYKFELPSTKGML
ncbi:MAG: imidazoleglycerol-phosphate dehydratase HisB [Bacteroidales bacterium]|nr:imidazoleglycerol-phosphate dehydratase HisB [Bacteroidales bacterium]MCM1148114.1 imidazoleglycerol-phosphate dehydratase HisB [Bacteroidales bacterium]MCM1206530.1 imidazoleglycerol-phosphate dehydratase HisB [Bacillota bacterium]